MILLGASQIFLVSARKKGEELERVLRSVHFTSSGGAIAVNEGK